uniref:Uncharacterized protein n=1 Tax=Strombidium inclinatum TaxID=197538 RepID=A0A7S3N1Y3_9SPIT|mmetsp:Transcript_40654/g.61985  ORF Transcript_40654/g.61985 Transcript_40654/m.61985 type:complete len:255 (+) Transcript_40654:1572-2336(+)
MSLVGLLRLDRLWMALDGVYRLLELAFFFGARLVVFRLEQVGLLRGFLQNIWLAGDPVGILDFVVGGQDLLVYLFNFKALLGGHFGDSRNHGANLLFFLGDPVGLLLSNRVSSDILQSWDHVLLFLLRYLLLSSRFLRGLISSLLLPYFVDLLSLFLLDALHPVRLGRAVLQQVFSAALAHGLGAFLDVNLYLLRLRLLLGDCLLAGPLLGQVERRHLFLVARVAFVHANFVRQLVDHFDSPIDHELLKRPADC